MKKTNLLKAAVSLLLSATGLFTGCTALTDGVTSDDAVTGGERYVNGSRNAVIYTRDLGAIDRPDKFDYIVLFSLKLNDDLTLNESKFNNRFINGKEGMSISDFRSRWNKGRSLYGKNKPKLILCFGSDGAQKKLIQDAVKSDSACSTLADRLTALIQKHNLDGIDIDWEFNEPDHNKGHSDGTYDGTYSENDKKYTFRCFSAEKNAKNCKELIAKLTRRGVKTITMCCRTETSLIKTIGKTGCFNGVKFINLMAYESDFSTAKKCMSALYDQTGSGSKINLGIGIEKSIESIEERARWIRDNCGHSYGVMLWVAENTDKTHQEAALRFLK